MTIPSWCKVGAKVACVRGTLVPDQDYAKTINLPIDGEVYTLRSVETEEDKVFVRLVEIKNRFMHFLFDAPGEPAFSLNIFRPLVTERDDLEAHFNQHLHHLAALDRAIADADRKMADANRELERGSA